MAKQSMVLQIAVTTEDGVQHVRFAGSVNEDSRRQLTLLAPSLAGTCVFDMVDIQHINSCGVREWIMFIRVASKGRSIRFENCPPVMVDQFSMVPNMIENVTVGSVLGRSACVDCNHTVTQTFVFDGSNAAPPGLFDGGVCGRCGGAMELIEDDVYLTFLEGRFGKPTQKAS
jgi:hypothetical protein